MRILRLGLTPSLRMTKEHKKTAPGIPGTGLVAEIMGAPRGASEGCALPPSAGAAGSAECGNGSAVGGEFLLAALGADGKRLAQIQREQLHKAFGIDPAVGIAHGDTEGLTVAQRHKFLHLIDGMQPHLKNILHGITPLYFFPFIVYNGPEELRFAFRRNHYRGEKTVFQLMFLTILTIKGLRFWWICL